MRTLRTSRSPRAGAAGASRNKELGTSDSTQTRQKSQQESCTQLTDGKKSEARALLRHFASGVPDQKTVDGYVSVIKAGEDGIADPICNILESIHVLREEFAAWVEGHTVHDPVKCRARSKLADAGRMFNKPTPQFAHEEIDITLDIYTRLLDDRDVQEVICLLVQYIYDLRDDLIAWGRDDLTPWEREQEVSP